MRWLVWLILAVGLAPAQPVWQRLESSEGKFAVLMPGVARRGVVPLPTAAGSLQQHQYLVDLERRAFMLTYLDYPESTLFELGAEQILNNVLEGIKSSGGTILQEQELDISNSEGYDVFYRKPSGYFIHSRLLLVGPRFYQLTLVHPGPDPDPDAARFFDSFRFSP